MRQIIDKRGLINLLQEFFTFPPYILETYQANKQSKKIKMPIPAFQELAKYNNIKFDLLYNNKIEEMKNEDAIIEMWKFVFRNNEPPNGRVLLYPSVDCSDKAYAVILDKNELKELLFGSEYKNIFDVYPSVTMGDFYFLFLDSLKFYGFEHPGITYSFEINKRG